MPKLSDKLAALHQQLVAAREADARHHCREMDRKHSRQIRRLVERDVVTVGDLISRLPALPPVLLDLGIWLISVLEIRQAANVLLTLLPEPRMRCQVACTLAFLHPGRRVERVFLRHGRRELKSHSPNHLWLESIVQGLTFAETPEGAELLVSIFERTDLPGWLRGDAADKLGGTGLVQDRRTRLYRRSRDAALRGLNENDMEVQFWSMYLLMSLANRCGRQSAVVDQQLARALPRLQEIAANDQRLAPGFWWPMSAEAEDAISCIATGRWLDPDAADRWSHNSERGAMNRD